MDDAAQEGFGDDDYSRLPMAIRVAISRTDYLWMSDAQKARLVQDETEPDDE